MAYAQYYLYPASTSSHTSSSRQYSPIYYHHHHHHHNYLNPVNNYYTPSFYRWPTNYMTPTYNYNTQSYGYNYSNVNYNTNNNVNSNSNNVNSNRDTNSKSITRHTNKKIKFNHSHHQNHNSNDRAKSIKKSSVEKAIQPINEKQSKYDSPPVKQLALAAPNTNTNSKQANEEQKNKENLKLQLISQLNNQTQIELGKLMEMKNKRRQITYLGIVTANPSDYVKKYGKDLVEPVKESQDINLPLEKANTNRSDTDLTVSENLDDALASITVEPSTSNRTLNHNTNTTHANVINERTYKLAVDENGTYSLKAI